MGELIMGIGTLLTSSCCQSHIHKVLEVTHICVKSTHAERFTKIYMFITYMNTS